MKPFVIYTLMRLALFVATYFVVAGLWVIAFGRDGVLLVPFLIAVVVSSVLSLRLLAPQRERFAAVVQARAERATARFEEMRAKEDADAEVAGPAPDVPSADGVEDSRRQP